MTKIESAISITGKSIWLIAGLLFLMLIVYARLTLADIKEASQEVDRILSEVTIDDIRGGMDIVNTELDIQRLELELRVQDPLSFTEENWQSFLDYCGRTGYVVSDFNWQEYRYGRLLP